MYRVKNRFRNSKFTVAGDFNLPDIDWNKTIINGYRYSTEVNNFFLESFFDLGLEQINTNPTRRSNILEIYLTNNVGNVSEVKTVPGVGDHESALLVTTRTTIFRRKKTKRKIFLWKSADHSSIRKQCKDFASCFIKHHSSLDPIEKLWNCIKSSLNTIINDNVDTKITSSNWSKPWITPRVRKLIRKKKKWYNKMKSCPNSERVSNKYHCIKKETQREIRKEHNKYVNDIICDNKENNKRLYAYIKHKNQGNHSGIEELEDRQGKIHQEPSAKAKILNDQFCSVFSDPSRPATQINKEKLPSTMEEIQVNAKGVNKLLKNINIHKSSGPDGIPGIILKNNADELTPVFTILYQASLNQGVVPDDWKNANITPLFKKGNKKEPENYRPVSLTSISCKLLEHIIHSSIMRYLDTHSILNDAQHGFRKKRSCESQLITTCSDFVDAIEKNLQIDAIFLDFSKAFDKVHHKSLLLKLDHLGIRGKTLKWIESFLIGRKQKVLVEGKESSSREVQSGVPQGTVLGPLLFLIYINDMSDNLSDGTRLRLFADDSMLYRVISTPDDSKILQNDLNTLQEWEKSWKMEFHPKKCQVIRITHKRQFIKSNYFIHNTQLTETNTAKYLGIMIDNKMSWDSQVDSVCSKANRTLAFIRRNLKSCPKDVKTKCYNTYVRPITEYCSSVWDPFTKKNIQKLENIQRRAARFIHNNYDYHDSVTKLLLEMKWTPLEERRARSKMTIVHKAINENINIPIENFRINPNKTRSGGINYVIPRSRTNTHINSFYPSSIRLWNSLPDNIKDGSLERFKNGLENYTIRGQYAV